MESIKYAFQSLKAGISRSKTNEDVGRAIDKLSTVLDILKLGTLENASRMTLCDLLRHAIQPLYKHDLALTLNYSSAVLLGLHASKVNLSQDVAVRMAWETTQCAVLSGLLDHLEAHRAAKTKNEIGHAFYASLCKLYFSTQPSERVNATSDLLTAVYMLLSVTVSGQGTNASKFRKELIGGRRLGYTIYNTRDLLPLEAVLELVANLLLGFRSRNSRERIRFLQEVFSPQLFPNSSELVEYLLKVTTSRAWTQVSSKVIIMIALLDVSFLQPFEISDFHLRGLETKKIKNMFIETASFLSSIPLPGGTFDTLVIPFRIVAAMSLFSSGQQITVSLTLKAPPIIGYDPVDCGQTDIRTRWKIGKDDLPRFLNSLKRRKVPFDSSALNYSKKLSVAEAGVTLDINLESITPHAMQDKAIAIAKLWDGPGPSRETADCNPTSPLLNSIFPPNSQDKFGIPFNKPSQTVFIDREGNFTDLPPRAVEPPVSAARKEKADTGEPKVSANKKPRDEGEMSQPKPPARRKSLIVISDESDLTDENDFDIPSPTPAKRHDLRREPSMSKRGKRSDPVTEDLYQKKVRVTAPKDLEPRLEQEIKRGPKVFRAKEAIPQAESESLARSVLPTAKKRHAPLDAAPPTPPLKKPRTSSDHKQPPTTRYSRRKLRGSTPPTVINLDFTDDDEPPKGMKSGRKKDPEPTGRRMVMKDKNGKPKPKPVPPKRKAGTNKQNTPAVEVKDVKPNIATTAKANVKSGTLQEKDKNTLKRALSVKLEVMTPHLKKAEEVKSVAAKSSTKPQKAIWQRESFMANVRKMSTPQRTPCVESEQIPVEWAAPEGAFQLEPEPEPQAVIVVSDGSTTGSETFINEQAVNEYWSPTKGSVESFYEDEDPVVVEEEDAVMIDLTSQNKPVTPVVAKRKAMVILTEGKPESRPASPVATKREVPVFPPKVKQGFRPPAPVSVAATTITKAEEEEVRRPEKVLESSKKSGQGQDYSHKVTRLKVGRWSDRKRPENSRKAFEPEASSSFLYERPSASDRRSGNGIPRRARDPAESIPEILQMINEALLDKINQKFEDATQGMSQATLAILQRAADDLKPMYDEAAEHFNAMVDLEAEYATHRRNIMTAMDSLRKSAGQAAAAAKQTAQNHSRFGLSRKFPSKLFSKPLPTVQLLH